MEIIGIPDEAIAECYANTDPDVEYLRKVFAGTKYAIIDQGVILKGMTIDEYNYQEHRSRNFVDSHESTIKIIIDRFGGAYHLALCRALYLKGHQINIWITPNHALLFKHLGESCNSLWLHRHWWREFGLVDCLNVCDYDLQSRKAFLHEFERRIVVVEELGKFWSGFYNTKKLPKIVK